MKKQLAILGSTGSIGKQALEVVRSYPDLFAVETLTAHNNARLLIEQAIEFRPGSVVIANNAHYSFVSDSLSGYPVKVFAGEDSVEQIVDNDAVDMVLNALVGYAGMRPTLAAVKAGRHVALANKESLVIAGELIMAAASANHVAVIPVDSEHSAIFQCLNGEPVNQIEKIFLTASGGPFLGKSLDELKHITREDALKHPNWSMGDKITIDSATLMNKGLEVIEAHWLFNLLPEQIEVVIHPQSVIHSMVQFTDGSVKAQMGVPDMRLPVLYALTYPARVPSRLPRIDFSAYSSLTFGTPDRTVFRNLDLAYEALRKGGNVPCVLNAANEAAVTAFLQNKIKFLDIPDIIEECMPRISFVRKPGLDDYVKTHLETIEIATQLIDN